MVVFGELTGEFWADYYGRPKPPKPVTPEEIMADCPCLSCPLNIGKGCRKTIKADSAVYCGVCARWLGKWWTVVCREVRNA